MIVAYVFVCLLAPNSIDKITNLVARLPSSEQTFSIESAVHFISLTPRIFFDNEQTKPHISKVARPIRNAFQKG